LSNRNRFAHRGFDKARDKARDKGPLIRTA
jgi:hypothetical protein